MELTARGNRSDIRTLSIVDCSSQCPTCPVLFPKCLRLFLSEYKMADHLFPMCTCTMPHTEYHVQLIPFPVVMRYVYFRFWLIVNVTFEVSSHPWVLRQGLVCYPFIVLIGTLPCARTLLVPVWCKTWYYPYPLIVHSLCLVQFYWCTFILCTDGIDDTHCRLMLALIVSLIHTIYN